MPSSPILVTFALPEESQDFRQALRKRGDERIQVEHFGVGPAMAAARIESLLKTSKPQLLICAGFAGGLDSRLGTGDLVIGENLCSEQFLALGRTIGASQPGVTYGSIVSRATPVETAADKQALFEETRALAVDMESETIAAACQAAGVPVFVVRTISDPATEDLPVPFADWFDIEGQRPRVWALLKYLAGHPGRIGPFAHFVLGLGPARRSLAAFLIRFFEGWEAGQTAPGFR